METGQPATAPTGRGRSFRALLGGGLSIVAIITLVAALCSVSVKANVDYPVEAGMGAKPDVQPTSRIVVALSLYPRWGRGGTTYAVGATDQEQYVVDPHLSLPGPLTLVRQGEALVVEGRLLGAGDSYERAFWRQSWDPWLLETARLQVRNAGRSGGKDGPDALWLRGQVAEGWSVSPLGPMMLLAGVWLFLSGWRR